MQSVHDPGGSGEKEANTVSRSDASRSTWNIGGVRDDLPRQCAKATASPPTQRTFGESVSRETCLSRAVQKPCEHGGPRPYTPLRVIARIAHPRESPARIGMICAARRRRSRQHRTQRPTLRAPRLLHVRRAPRPQSVAPSYRPRRVAPDCEAVGSTCNASTPINRNSGSAGHLLAQLLPLAQASRATRLLVPSEVQRSAIEDPAQLCHVRRFHVQRHVLARLRFQVQGAFDSPVRSPETPAVARSREEQRRHSCASLQRAVTAPGFTWNLAAPHSASVAVNSWNHPQVSREAVHAASQAQVELHVLGEPGAMASAVQAFHGKRAVHMPIRPRPG